MEGGIEFSLSEPKIIVVDNVGRVGLVSTGLAAPDSNDLMVGCTGDAVRSLRRYPVSLVLRLLGY